MVSSPRFLRPVPDELGLYFRAGHIGHTVLHKRLLETDAHQFNGVLLSAAYSATQQELRQELRARRLEAVLDTQALELATPSGVETASLQRLRWAGNKIHRPEDLDGGGGVELSEAIAKHAIRQGYSSVLTPTHFIQSTDDPWLEVDRKNTVRLRRCLDSNGGEVMPLYYLLAIHSKVLGDPEARRQVLDQLASIDIDGLWLRVHPFGNDSGPVALRRCMEAAVDLCQLRVPIIGEKVGSAGLALLAFNALGGICCGLTLGEKFDALRLYRPRRKGGNMAPRVYVEALGAYLSKEDAQAFFAPQNRTQARYGCRDKGCCRRGVQDPLADPQRHFFYTRIREVNWISGAPPTARPNTYLNDFLRPANDRSIRAARIAPSLVKLTKQLAGWRDALRVVEENAATRRPRAPKGVRLRRSRSKAQIL